ncbi:hypothetical protein M433DRAFT_157862 [Acidomyces richmondensis BFW]|nr:MAG: hypothetical protein FE78DRAFT_84410 [Acidomyces sp. 'richmondensis']KYG42458.1 hypothetical protein M433DRAFT_157862 [Acidomyces richmondensis BFW]
MAPKSPWNKNSAVIKNAQKSYEQANTPAINYGLAQSEEIEVLSAIYMDDFEEVELKGAWSKLTDRSFKLTLRSFSDPESFVKLSVRLTATYPKSAPLLEIVGLDGYHERTQKRIYNIIQSRPQQLLGEVMIHAIASEIQEALEDAVIARQHGTLPSLEDERASAEEVANALAKEAAQAETKRKREAQEEEDRVLKAMVDEELSRREKRKSLKPAVIDESTQDNTWERVSFDQPAFIQSENITFQYSSVVILSMLSHKQDEDLYLGQPVIGSTATTRPLVAVKKLITRKNREKILELEKSLETVSKLRHNNLLSLFTYRIDRLDTHRSQVILCSEFADRGTLHDLLEIGALHIKKARQFTIELLEALEYLHHHGVVHGEVSSTAIYLAGIPSLSPKLGRLGQGFLQSTSTTLHPKWQSPDVDASSPATQRKSDIWDLGVVAVQMFLGLQALNDYQGPHAMLGRLNVSDAFEDFMRKVFTIEAKKRPSAFELLPVEFLRTDAAVLEDAARSLQAPASISTRKVSSSGIGSPAKRRSRHNSSSVVEPLTVSRYSADFVELGRLGKGGFGEVVKARNKLDGGVYAVKKVKQAPQLLDQVLSEVMLLNRLNHPYVVRYFSTWVENDISSAILEEDTTTTANTTTGDATVEESSDGLRYDFGFQSAGGLDFVSSSGYPHIEFDEDDEADGEDRDSSEIDTVSKDGAQQPNENAVNEELHLKRSRSESHRLPSILYIQMEFCERHTLRDLVRKGMSSDEAWRFLRQIIEGLAHIHGHGIIHRDLKPENVFVDMANNPKIGDFGLATTAQYHFAERAAITSGQSGEEMTRSVGTTLYVAPELRSTSGVSCTEKVDMYSLGIMFYEMCEHFSTAMERINALQLLRQSNFELPQNYRSNGDKSAQGRLIACLIAHKPSERPSSTELLRSDMIPIMVEDETIRQALSGLSDPRSPHHRALMSALFSLDSSNLGRVKALAWDANWVANAEDASRLRLRSVARCILECVFRRHGAEETRRESIFPRSGYYTDPKVVQLLDASGNLLQLPYDLTLPNARYLARHMPKVKRSFVFGAAYRDSLTGGPPNVFEEVDFDIVQYRPEEEPSLDDAEILKVTDEIFCEVPTFTSGVNICFHLNHALILDVILDHCRVPLAQQATVKETISRLGFLQCTWPKIRSDLRKFGLPDTTLEDLEQFDFRDVPKKAFDRLRQLFDSSNSRSKYKLEQGIRSLSEILSIASQFNMQRRIYIVPLGSVNAKFYEDGMLFQCVLERKSNNKVVIAAGGRYDSLIRAHHAMHTSVACPGAVGVAIGLDSITAHMSKNSEESQGKSTYLKTNKRPFSFAKRCDVLVESKGSEGSMSTAIKILESLWASDISAELSTGVQTSELGVLTHLLIVEVRHEASTTVRVTNTSTGEEDDIPSATLLSHVRQTLRDFESTKLKQTTFVRQTSHAENESKGNVQVLMAQHRSKKSNKFHIVAEAQQRWSEMVESWKRVPILAVETRDDVMELFRETRLGDTESWRKVVQRVPLNERQYVQQVQDILNSWRKGWLDNDGAREACIFNFRTGQCIYYDLGL